MRAESKVEEWMNKPGEASGSEDEEDVDEEGSQPGEDDSDLLDVDYVERQIFTGRTGARLNFLRNGFEVTPESKYCFAFFLAQLAVC